MLLKKIITKSLILSFTFVVFSSVFTANAQAPESVGMTISPPTFEMTANPGDVIQNSVKLTNITSSPITITTDTRNFTAIGETGSVGLVDEESPFELANWVRILPVSITIEPNSSEVFQFVIDVPEDASPGGHYGAVVFINGENQDAQQTGASVAQEISSLILLKVSGDIRESAEILSFNPTQSFFEYGPANFEFRISNTGNVHIKPTGTITLTNMFGQTVDSFQFEPKNVVPGKIRRVPATWETDYLLGRYTATAVLNYGADNSTMVASTTVVGFPYKTVGAVTLGVLFVLLLMLKSRKRLGKALKVLFSG